jgi:hypothetical protein
MTAPRDQVLDAIWPDLDPMDALNSLNQTVYFLRRVFEEDYVDDLSPGYVHHESDLIWLDQPLVVSRSNECRSLIKSFGASPNPEQVTALVERYEGRFAWTSNTRNGPRRIAIGCTPPIWRSSNGQSCLISRPDTSTAGSPLPKGPWTLTHG